MNIGAAKAAVGQAELNLARSTIRAPFDAHILNQNVTNGSQVAPGDDLGRIVGTDFYWVTATVPVSKLQWLSFNDGSSEKGAQVRITNPTAWTADAERQGFLDRQIDALDGQTRLARILVKVPDPLATQSENEDLPKLMIGTFVEVNIQAKPIENVIRLDRDFIRSNETVWVMKDEKLEIRKVEIVLNDDEYAYISEGLAAGDQVVITDLSTVTNGIGLRTSSEGEEQ